VERKLLIAYQIIHFEFSTMWVIYLFKELDLKLFKSTAFAWLSLISLLSILLSYAFIILITSYYSNFFYSSRSPVCFLTFSINKSKATV
jgi:fatty acid desaturase